LAPALRISKCRVGVLGNARAAARAYFEEKHFGAGIVGRDGCDRSGKAKPGHDDVVTLLHRGFAFHNI
jgi:hypothetical protein